MKEGVTVIHYMADGTICRTPEELREYGRTHPLPPMAKRLIAEFIEDGYRILAEREKRAGQ